MPVNWDATVLTATQAAFGYPIALFPKSGVGPLSIARDGVSPLTGILRYQSIDFMMDDGTKVSTVEINLGIRLSTFIVFPKVGDTIKMVSPVSPFGVNSYTIDRFNPDGLGGASLVLKALQPTPTTG